MVVRVPPVIQELHRRTGPSEERILVLAAAGMSLRKIADRVGLSHETVRNQLRVQLNARVDGGLFRHEHQSLETSVVSVKYTV